MRPLLVLNARARTRIELDSFMRVGGREDGAPTSGNLLL